MSVQEIEAAIRQLPPQDLAQLAGWFDEYVEAGWDARIEADAKAGKLSRLKAEALRAEAQGELLDFP